MVPFKTKTREPDIVVNTGRPDAINIALGIDAKDGTCGNLAVVTAVIALSVTAAKLMELTVLSSEGADGLPIETEAELLGTIDESVCVAVTDLERSVFTEVGICVSGRPDKEMTDGATCKMLRFEDDIVLDSAI